MYLPFNAVVRWISEPRSPLNAALSGVDQDVDNRTPHRSFLGVASAC